MPEEPNPIAPVGPEGWWQGRVRVGVGREGRGGGEGAQPQTLRPFWVKRFTRDAILLHH